MTSSQIFTGYGLYVITEYSSADSECIYLCDSCSKKKQTERSFPREKDIQGAKI